MHRLPPGWPYYHIHNASGYRFLNATPVPLFFFVCPPNTYPTHRSRITFEPRVVGGDATEVDSADG